MEEHNCAECIEGCAQIEELKETLADFFGQTGYSAYDIIFGISEIMYDVKASAEEEGDFNYAEMVGADIDAIEACLDKIEQNSEFFGNCKGSGVDC